MLKFAVSVLAFAYACALSLYAGDEYQEVRSKALAHFIMAQIHDYNGRSSEAAEEYERSISLDKAQIQPHLHLASFYARAGQLAKARQQLKDVFLVDPANIQAHYLLALVYSSDKDYESAAKEYEKILAVSKDQAAENIEIHTSLAQLYFTQQKYAKAVEEFKQVLVFDPDNTSAHYLLGSCYLELKELINARDQFKSVLKVEPGNDSALNSLAYVFALLRENLDDALTMARKAIDIDASNGAYYDTLGWILHQKGLESESLLALQKGEMYIKDPVLFDHMGDVYKSIKENALARKYWHKSLELDSNQPSVKAKIDSLEKIQASSQ